MQILEWVKRQTAKLADNVRDYKFFVKHEPNFIDSSTTLILTAYSNRNEIDTIPCVYRWSRIKNGLLSQVPEFKGNLYICQPSDIGCIIQAEVTSTDYSHPGTAVLKFGPVKLDVLVKRQVQHALASGNAFLNVDLIQKDEIRECQIKITEQNIKISDCNSNIDYNFDYTLGEPRIQASINELNKVNIYFNEKYDSEVTKFTTELFGYQDLSESVKLSNEKKLELRFQNRAMKDNFLLIIKAFNTKKAMKTSAIVNKMENINLSGDENFNYVLEVESLRADLIKLARLNDKFLADKRVCYEENRKLQKQIEQIIVTYTKIVEGKFKNQNELDQSIMELRQKKDEVMERKINYLVRQNETLKDQLEEMKQEILSRNSQYIIMQGEVMKNNVQYSTRGFIKKRTIPEVSANQLDQLLDNLNESNMKNQEDGQLKVLTQQRSMLAKKLNESIVKIAKLEEKVKELKLNQTTMGLENPNNFSNISEICSDSSRHNVTAMELNSKQREKFCAEIDELRKKNLKLKEQNYKLKLKSQIPMISSKSERMNIADIKSQKSIAQDNKSHLSKTSSVDANQQLHQDLNSQLNQQLNPEMENLTKQKEWSKIVQELTSQNSKLKEEISKLIMERDKILKQKSSLEAKYKKKVGELASQNSMYRRSQDALNRSQNLSMEMDSYTQQQLNLLKEQNEFLSNENIKVTKMYQKSIQELKQIPKLKEEILRLTNELTGKKNADLSLSNSEGEINLLNQK